jgi:hypothetical protein
MCKQRFFIFDNPFIAGTASPKLLLSEEYQLRVGISETAGNYDYCCSFSGAIALSHPAGLRLIHVTLSVLSTFEGLGACPIGLGVWTGGLGGRLCRKILQATESGRILGEEDAQHLWCTGLAS